MANFTVDIPDIETTVHREAIDSIVRNTMNHFGLGIEDYIYMGAYNTAHQPNSTNGAVRDLSFGSSEKAIVEVDERINPDGMNSRGQGTDNHVPIFQDPYRGIMVVPSPARYDVTITVTYRAPGRPAVNNWATSMRRRIALGGDLVDTQADFHYLIPPEILNVLAAIGAAGGVKVPGYTLDSMLKQYFGKAVTVITNSVGGVPSFAVRCTLGRVIAYCDPSADIVPEKSGDGGAWQAQMQIQLQYERPEALTVYYPVVVNNTILPEKFWMDLSAPGMSDPYGMMASKVLLAAEYHRDTLPLPLPVYIPRCDVPILEDSRMYWGEINMFVGFFEMDPLKLAVKPFSLEFGLDYLGDVNFTPRVVTYMKYAFKLDSSGQDSLFRLFIYSNSRALAAEQVAVDENLAVYGNFDFDVTALYQFAVTCRTTFEGISDEGLDIIRYFPDIVRDIIIEFYPWFPRIYPDIWQDILDAIARGLIEPGQSGGGILGSGGGILDWSTIDRIYDILNDVKASSTSGGSSSGGSSRDPIKNGVVTNVVTGSLIAHRRVVE